MDVKEMQRRILKLIKIHDVTLSDLSRKTNLNLQTLKHYSNEMYVLKQPSAAIIMDLADFFQVPTDYILGRCELGENYEVNIKELYEKSYETYLRRWKRNATTEDIVASSESPLYDAGYPYNLIDKINCDIDDPIDVPLSDDQMAFLEKVLDNELFGRETDCIRLYFCEKHTLSEIADMYNVTPERIRQILSKALRKLRHPARLKLIKYGYDVAINLNKDIQAAKTKRSELVLELKKACSDIEFLKEALEKVNEDAKKKFSSEMTFPEMNLSVRPFNCLARWFIYRDKSNSIQSYADLNKVSIFDVKRVVMDGTLANVRNIGKKSSSEVIRKLDEFGMLSIEDIEKLAKLYPYVFEEVSA